MVTADQHFLPAADLHRLKTEQLTRNLLAFPLMSVSLSAVEGACKTVVTAMLTRTKILVEVN